MTIVGSVEKVEKLLAPFGIEVFDDLESDSDSDSIVPGQIPASLIEDALNFSVKAYFEKVMNVPIGETEERTYYVNVPQEALEVLLPVKSFNSVVSLHYLNGSLLSTSDYHVDFRYGMIQAKTNKYFSAGKNNMKAVLDVGLINVPDDVNHAACLIAAAMFLVYQEAIDGSPASLTVVAYSESYAQGGKYGKQYSSWFQDADIILTRYTSPV